MKFPQVLIGNKPEFEKRLGLWMLMRDVFADGSWDKLAVFLGAGPYCTGPKRIRKKRLRRFMIAAMLRDSFEYGEAVVDGVNIT